MYCNRLTAIAIIMLGLAFNPVMAEPGQKNTQQDKSNISTVTTQKEVWGDPEEESETVWTWFGMGYEMRNHGIKSSVSPLDDNGDSSSHDGGHQHQNK